MNSFRAFALSLVLCLMIAGNIWADDPETLTFLHYYFWPAGSQAMQNVVDAIERAHPRLNIQAASFDAEAYKAGLPAMLPGESPPDLVLYWAGARTQSLVGAGHLRALDDVWEHAELHERFTPAVVQACRYDGHPYIIPLTQYFISFFYNTRVFRELNLTVPGTWEVFLAMCQRLQSEGITPIALGTMDKWPAQAWFDYLLLRTAGPAYRQQLMTGKASYTDPEVDHVFQLWKQLVEQGFFNQTPSVYNWEDALRMVFHGQAAMTLKAHWVMSVFDEELGWRPQKDYDFFAFPTIDPSVPLVAVGPIDGVALPFQVDTEAARTALVSFADAAPQQEMSWITGSLAPNIHIPNSFYTGIQQRIRQTANQAGHWAFNYDLATPPPVAEIGLQHFVEFLEHPARYQEILQELEQHVKPYFVDKHIR